MTSDKKSALENAPQPMTDRCLILIALTAILVGTAAAQKVPATATIPDEVSVKVKAELTPWRAKIETDRAGLASRAAEQNKNCVPAPPEPTATAKCREGQTKFNEDAENFGWDVREFNAVVKGYVVIARMNKLASTLPDWTPAERKRLSEALGSLDADGDRDKSRVAIQKVWDDMAARGESLIDEAAKGSGPNLIGAGTQMSQADCAIFALAAASGQPYGVVAARAMILIGEGTWREADEIADPPKAIDRGGLMGGEVVFLAEAFGQARVVKSTDFAKTISAGKPVMVNVFPREGSAHEVVLSRTFTHDGETWFELMDSYQGPMRRLYLSHADLMKILKETGVTYNPSGGTTPRSLKQP